MLLLAATVVVAGYACEERQPGQGVTPPKTATSTKSAAAPKGPPGVTDKTIKIDQPDVLIIEGLNVLQTGKPPTDGKAIPYVSDFFDFSVYLDADEEMLRTWYIERFLQLRGTAFSNPQSYFHRYASLTDDESRETANRIWETINLANLRENVLPTRQRADLIMRKDDNHAISSVALRKL